MNSKVPSGFIEREPRTLTQQPRRCYILIVNWNGWKDTVNCLESVFRLNYPDFRVIVCDNDSTDGSLERIKVWARDRATPLPCSGPALGLRKVPPHAGEEKLSLIQTGANLGFAGGNNVGIRYACADPACGFIWLLNNDTIVDGEALTAMSEEAERDCDVGAVGAICFFESDPSRVQSWGGSQVNLWTGFVRTNTQPRPNAWFHYIYGASLLLKRETLDDVGFMDESYFLYYEETEYCLRIRAKGWRLAVANRARVLHKVNASTGSSNCALDRYFTTSGLRLLRKYSPLPFIAMPMFVVLRLGKRISQLRMARCREVLRGARDFCKTDSTSN